MHTEMKRKATLVDVAKLSGVSRSMVSYVLNNFDDCKAKTATKQKILNAAKALDYHFNAAARALRNGRSQQIGVVMPGPFISFYANMISLLQSELKKHGYSAIFGLWGNHSEDQQTVLRDLVNRNNLAGIIAWDMDIPNLPGLSGIPVVLFSNYDSPQRFDTVDTDIDFTIHQALDHLTGCGYRKIGYCGILRDPRAELTERLIREKRLPFEPQWFLNCTVDEEDIRANIQKLRALPEQPEALMFNNDLVAVAACRQMEEFGMKRPAMVSLQDGDLLRFHTPRITAFDTKEEKLAVALVDLLIRRLSRRKSPLTAQYIQPELIVRESTRPHIVQEN
ncbi:MAG: LacI family transcriptional regulator [Lentisphaeria bacterium]|nr:LacI family transcriptional regulator [Lentisphaeria bacterium]